MTAIPRALGRATEQLGEDQRHAPARCRAADGRRARHRPRPADPRQSHVARRPPPSSSSSSGAAPGEPVAYITGQRAFWTIDLEVGPGALVPRPDSETLIAAAVEHFAGHAGPEADPRPRHRPGHPAARRARRMAQGHRPRHRRVGGSARPMPGATPHRLGLPDRADSGSATGPRASTSASTSSCAIRPMSPPAPKPGPGSPNMSRPRRCSPGPTGSTTIAASRRRSAACSRPAAWRRSRSASTRPNAPRPCSSAQGFVRRSRCDLGGRPRALLIKG